MCEWQLGAKCGRMIACEFEDGKRAALRHVAVDAIVIDDQRNVLLVKRAPSMLVEPSKWALPGGFLERDENVFTALRRELFEETGYEATTIDLFAVISDPNRGDDRQNITFVFAARPGECVGIADNESTEQKWWPIDALPANEELAFDHGSILEKYVEHAMISRYQGPIVY